MSNNISHFNVPFKNILCSCFISHRFGMTILFIHPDILCCRLLRLFLRIQFNIFLSVNGYRNTCLSLNVNTTIPGTCYFTDISYFVFHCIIIFFLYDLYLFHVLLHFF